MSIFEHLAVYANNELPHTHTSAELSTIMCSVQVHLLLHVVLLPLGQSPVLVD